MVNYKNEGEMKRFILIILILISFPISIYFIKNNDYEYKNITSIKPLIEDLSFEDVIKSSDLIIIGDVKKVNSFYIEKMILNDKSEAIKSYKIIVSEAIVYIESVLKGNLNKKSINVRFLGGNIDKDVTLFYDLPKLIEKEKIVLCLEKNNYLGDGDYYTIFHLGKFIIEGEMIKENQLLKDNTLTLTETNSKN